MNKLISLIKACMSDNMSLFKINNRIQSRKTKKILPIIIFCLMFFSVWTYANMFMEPLAEVNLEYVLLILFIIITTILTLIEGIYKAGNLLFNCKDDNILLSLPIKKSTVLFIRVFKFYVFELMYNSLFLLPALVVYLRYVEVGMSFYISTFFAILLLPIIPIIISCIIGSIISGLSSRFRLKNLVQIVITTAFLLMVFYISFNLQTIINNLAQNATSFNDLITKLYYPAGAYIKMITDFNVTDLLMFVLVHLSLFSITIILLSKIYFKINSNIKKVKTQVASKDYRIKTNKPIKALIKKEFKKFVSSPVFIINAGFGLVLFIVISISMCIKLEGIIGMMNEQGMNITVEEVKSYIPVIVFGLICFSSLMTSITSSMISLEGKTFNILKSLPVKPFTIIFSKVATAVIISVPFILIGNIIMFIKFRLNIFEMIVLLISSIILPLVSETLGILINLKYPKMDAENDTEVVKQSMSSTVAVFTGMIIIGLTVYILYKCLSYNIFPDLIILYGLIVYTIICLLLLIYLNKKGTKEFNSINV